MGKLLFHGIAVKPGKPTICGIIGKTLILGMPGYPTSCLTNAYVLLLPSIRKMARLPLELKREEVILAKSISSTIGRHQIYTVKVKDGKVYPAFKESGAITSMSMADGYIEIPANVEFLEEGSKVTVTYF
jgi:molybdopterin biosynthesis enzyme